MLKNLLQPLIIYGAGSMGRVVYSFIGRRRSVFAFCADDGMVHNDMFMDKPLIKLSHLLSLGDANYRILMAIGYHGMNTTRAERFYTFADKGFHMAGYVHPSVVVHDRVHLAGSCIIYDGVAIHPGSTVLDNAFISSNVSIGHDCDIGAHAWINSGVSLAGGVRVGARCVLGINACVAQGVSLGAGTFVGAGAVVTEDTDKNAVVVSPRSELLRMSSDCFTALTGQP